MNLCGPVVAVAGNPNTGKSTLFNALTGLKQHTGNWPGKTVALAWGRTRHAGREYVLVDLPGTYSLHASSPEERVARDFICLQKPAVTVVVTDATCLARNLALVLQVLELTPRTVVCVNLMDEAERRGLRLDLPALAAELGVPAVPAVARTRQGVRELLATVDAVATGRLPTAPRRIRYGPELEEAVRSVMPFLEPGRANGIGRRWLALRYLEGAHDLLETLGVRMLERAAT